MNRFWSKLLKVGLPVLLVAGVLAGFTLPVAAADPPGNPPVQAQNWVRGKVTVLAADETSFTVQSGDKTVAIKVDENTKYYKVDPSVAIQGRVNRAQALKENLKARLDARKDAIKNRVTDWRLGRKNGPPPSTPAPNPAPRQAAPKPRPAFDEQAVLDWAAKNGKAATFADIAIGDMVGVQLMPDEALAKTVIITKAPAIARVQGVITDVTGNAITIKPTTGDAVTLKWDASTRFVLHLKGVLGVQPGQTATAVYSKDTMLTRSVTVKAA